MKAGATSGFVVPAHFLDDLNRTATIDGSPNLASRFTWPAKTPSRENTPPEPARIRGSQANANTMSAPV